MADINVTEFELRSIALECAVRSIERHGGTGMPTVADSQASTILGRAARFEHYLRTGSTIGTG